MPYTIMLPEVGGRIRWTIEVVPDCDDVGRYQGALSVKVIDSITFAGERGGVAEPDSEVDAREMGRWLYDPEGGDYVEEIDDLVRAAMEKAKEYAE